MTIYNQPIKCKARHYAIDNAIKMTTVNRVNSSIVERCYVRNLYDFFIQKDEISDDKNEVLCIDKSYITAWEKLHDSCVSTKRPEDLKICYLCGPEPNNDFKEFIDYGVLPHNIWAFENKHTDYCEALNKFTEGEYPQPRIIKQNIESFFRNSDQKFDIVYLDFCCSFVSDKHGLKCVKTLFEKGRLNTNGVLITNYSLPDFSKNQDELIDLISLYMYFKRDVNFPVKVNCGTLESEDYNEERNKIKHNLSSYYGEFISIVIRDLASVIVPVQKLWHNEYFSNLIKESENNGVYEDYFYKAKNNSLAKFFLTVKYVIENKYHNNTLDKFLNELGGLDLLYDSFAFIIKMQNSKMINDDNLNKTLEYFESDEIYQFLDKVHKNMFWDIVVNQLTYPMHYNNKLNFRYEYIAKQNTMMMDVTCFDTCRYIYEWLPAIHQIKSAFLNKSWQYVFRFALDGLAKSRMQYNKEIFYQGSVTREDQEESCGKQMKERERIE